MPSSKTSAPPVDWNAVPPQARWTLRWQHVEQAKTTGHNHSRQLTRRALSKGDPESPGSLARDDAAVLPPGLLLAGLHRKSGCCAGCWAFSAAYSCCTFEAVVWATAGAATEQSKQQGLEYLGRAIPSTANIRQGSSEQADQACSTYKRG